MVGFGKVLRAVVFASFLLAAWTFARPAQAALLAPFCDDRGATALAPEPALEATDEAVSRVKTSACDENEPLVGLAVGPAHRAATAPSGPVEPARVIRGSPLLRALVGSLDFVTRATPRPRGVRGRVERPPRG
jgi:hypothetical protein